MLAFHLWNGRKWYEPWMDSAENVHAEWFDYQGIHHHSQLSNTQISTINALLKDIGTPRKSFFIGEPRSGSLSYRIYYSGEKEIRYTIKDPDIIIIQNTHFPYSCSMWKADKETVDRIIHCISASD